MLPTTQSNVDGHCPGQGRQSSFKRFPWFSMVLVGLSLRLIVAGFLYPEHLNPDRDYWLFAGEAGRIGRSLVNGQGFSSPFFGETGPTALMAPAYCYLVAAVFKTFGVYTKSSALFLLFLNCLFSAFTCLPVFFIARKNFGERAAHMAGWIWALFPYAIFFSADFLWPTVLSTLLLSLLFLWMLSMSDAAGAAVWLGFGSFSGVAALNDPIVLSVLPALGMWACYRRHKLGRSWLPRASMALLAFLLITSAWFIRNYQTFHRVIPVRDGFWLEVYLGNNGNGWHWAPPGFHPTNNEAEWQEYRHSGGWVYTA
jgi:4-amino-4-deoxy-L-arabinose transferase-like glycosyltransferase